MNSTILELYKTKLLDTLVAFDKFCTDYNLGYFACSGTALGAVRHNGIIPWDDDIDVYMLRDDYNKLVSLRDKLDKTHFRIAKMGDHGYIYPFAKFYDSDTTLIELEQFPDCKIGAFIDIFCFDEVDGNLEKIEETKKEYDKLFKKYQKTFIKPTLRWCLYSIRHLNIMSFYYAFCSKEKKKKIRENFQRFENHWINEKGDYLYCHHGTYGVRNSVFPKTWFRDYYYAKFNNIQIRLNTDIEKYLTSLFGDYMTPPPLSAQIPHHFYYYLNLKQGLTLEEVKERIAKGEHVVC